MYTPSEVPKFLSVNSPQLKAKAYTNCLPASLRLHDGHEVVDPGELRNVHLKVVCLKRTCGDSALTKDVH